LKKTGLPRKEIQRLSGTSFLPQVFLEEPHVFAARQGITAGEAHPEEDEKSSQEYQGNKNWNK